MAEGSGTRKGTAALTIGFYRNGYLYAPLGVSGTRGTEADYWMGRAASEVSGIVMLSEAGQLDLNRLYSKALGVSVHCGIPSLIFSPEAMGWPGEF